MIKAILLFIILGAGLFVGTEYSGQQGYVLISIAHKTIEMSVTTLVIVFIALLAIIFVLEYVVKKLLSTTFNTWNWFSVRKMRRSRRLTNEGIIKLLEGDYKQAEKKVIRWAKHHDNPLLCYLIAAEAAENIGDRKKRDRYLALASEQNASTLAVALTRARQLFNEGELEQSMNVLQSLQADHPNNVILLNLLKRIYAQLGKWQSLVELLPKLHRYTNLPEQEEQQLTVQAHQGLIAQVATRHNMVEDLLDHWGQIPRKAQKEPAIAVCMAKHILAINNGQPAFDFMTKQLKKAPNSELYILLVDLDEAHIKPALTLLLKQLGRDDNNAEAHSAAARLYSKQQKWSEAQHHLERALSLRSSVSDYALLAQVLEKQNKGQAAKEVANKALSLLP
ncbi:heme biosynthesis protein HemY [Vibrio nitrifigilis]|uniref:Heme biosynthesis protein HemY n=1 Tax=Vibrio nitrifigilis TaxID=2789781 RepID=A0ABS0GHQ5_9VIBR|nr:heme biosynthesis HemY N-terminal domain-containing protein [Vibrio nitrifigilis]MBF9001964.1 heme biosynthesis protein HemY [Vibrio nitrifigilis]